MTDVFARTKDDPGCLSGWMVSQLALDLLAPSASAQARRHTEVCPRCAGLLRGELEEQRAAAFERVPSSLMTAAVPAKRRWGTVTAAASLVFATAVAVMLIVPRSSTDSGLRTKGSAGTEVSVMRAAEVVVHAAPLERLKDLRAGDRLRIRATPTQPWVGLHGWEQGRWVEYFAGSPGEDGWVPVGVTLTGDEPTRLRLVSCAQSPRVRIDVDLEREPGCMTSVHEIEVAR